jgi:hypothetical protein
MVSSGMLRRVALVRTDVSEELTRTTRRNIPEHTMGHSHRRENLRSYKGQHALGLHDLPVNALDEEDLVSSLCLLYSHFPCTNCVRLQHNGSDMSPAFT